VSALVRETGSLEVHPFTANVLRLAIGIIDRQNLRALDAVQLSTALLASQSLPSADSIQFISSDDKLLEAARAEGFDTWNPCD
jgi:predicted nucleic acid-binding protein